MQDTLLGCKLVTQRDTFINKEDMMNILMNIMVSSWSCSQHCWPSIAAFCLKTAAAHCWDQLVSVSGCSVVAAAAVEFAEPAILSVLNRSGMALSLRQPS